MKALEKALLEAPYCLQWSGAARRSLVLRDPRFCGAYGWDRAGGIDSAKSIFTGESLAKLEAFLDMERADAAGFVPIAIELASGAEIVLHCSGGCSRIGRTKYYLLLIDSGNGERRHHSGVAPTLEHHAAQIRALMHTYPGPIYVMDEAFRYIYFNRASIAFQKMANGATLTKYATDRELMSEDAAHVARAEDEKILQTAKPVKKRLYFPATKDRSESFWNLAKAPIIADDGRVVGIFGCLEDMTEHLQSAQKIKELNKELEKDIKIRDIDLEQRIQDHKDIINNIPQHLLLLSYDGSIIDVNRAAAKGFGGEEKNLIGRKIFDLEAWLYPKIIRNKLESLSQENSERSIEFDMRVRRPGGRFGDHEIVMTRIPRPENKQSFFTVASHDITEKKMMHVLLQAEKDSAAAANRAKSSFLAMMSHEIRTPLNGIIGTIDILKGTLPVTHEASRLVEIVENSADILLDVIGDILDFSKIEAGEAELEMIALSPVLLVEKVVKTFKFEASAHNTRLTLVVGEGIPASVIGDGAKIRQVLTNLINNAIKFTKNKKEKTVLVRLECVDSTLSADGGTVAHLRYSIEDTGIGIASEKLDKLFEPFFQAEQSTTRKYGGSGLGLSISRGFAEMMGGTLDVESTLGEGSTFTLNLDQPVCEDEDENKRIQLAGPRFVIVLSADGQLTKNIETALSSVGITDIVILDPEQRDLTSQLRNFPRHALILDMENPALAGRSEALVTEKAELLIRLDNLRGSAQERQGHAEDRDSRTIWRDPLIPSDLVFPFLESEEGGISLSDDGERQELRADANKAMFGGQKVLLVEDNAINLEVIAWQLDALGLIVDTAVNGVLGEQMWRAGSYDMVISDWHMPEMDGLTLVSRIRKKDRTIPIVMLTADAHHRAGQRCLDAGADYYVKKPVKVKALTECVEKALKLTSDSGARGADGPKGADEGRGRQETLHILNFDKLADYLGPDKDMQKKQILRFRDYGAEWFEALPSARQSENRDAIAESAHSFKSAARMVCAESLGMRAELLEKHARKGNGGDLQKDVDALRTAFENFTSCVERSLGQALGP